METIQNNYIFYKLKFIFNFIKHFLYNLFVGSYTQKLYHNFLNSIPDNSTVLDIGIGNGYSLLVNSELIRKKNIKIIGVDIDYESIKQATHNIKEKNLENLIEVYNENIYNFKEGEYDYIFFSNSYSVIPNIIDMINHIKKKHLKKNGTFVISTTIENNYNPIKHIIKPNLKYLTFGIDFGTITLLDKFINSMCKNKLVINFMDHTCHKWYPIWGNIDIYTFYLTKNS